MEIRFLGPFDVVDADESISVGGGRQRALLAILALNAGEVVPVGRLIDELWPEHPPDSAHNTLQAYVSRLRKALRSSQRDGEKRSGSSMGATASTSRRMRSTRTASRGLVEEGERRGACRKRRACGERPSARHSRCGAGRRWSTSPTSPSLKPRSLASTSCGLPRSRPVSMPTSRCGRHSAARFRARGARERAAAPRGLSPRADARALPLGPTGRRARGLHGHTREARCRPRDRADAGAPRAPARDPAPGLRNSERPSAMIHDADGHARRRRLPLAVGLAAAAVVALAAAVDPPAPDARLRCRSRRAQLRRGRGRGDERDRRRRRGR